MRTGRPKSYHRDELLARALPLFWAEGFERVGLRELSAAMGVSQSSIYAEFGGKAGLFAATLDHYSRTVVDVYFGPVEAPDATVDTIATYLQNAIHAPNGCLMANSIVDLPLLDPAVALRVNKHLARQEQGILNVLRNALPSRESPSQADVVATAKATVVFIQGFLLLCRATKNQNKMNRKRTAELDATITTYVGTLTRSMLLPGN